MFADCTCFFIHENHSSRRAALESLTQQEPRFEIRVIEFRERADCLTQCLAARSTFTLLCEDDVQLDPGAVLRMARCLRWHRLLHPSTYRLVPKIRDELTGCIVTAGVQLFHTHSLKTIGAPQIWRNASTMESRAGVFGLSTTFTDDVLGTRSVVRSHEIYKRCSVERMLGRQGLLNYLVPTSDEFLTLYRSSGRIEFLYAAAGVHDATTAKLHAVSRHWLGPIGLTLRFTPIDRSRLEECFGMSPVVARRAA